MENGITLKVLGDFGPFSRVGKSIGYLVKGEQSDFLLDCGAPLFQQIGGHGLKEIDGLIITHCHDDHQRWFTDLALFYRYAPDFTKKVKLLTSEAINDNLIEGSNPAICTSLSKSGKNVVDIAYEDYVDFQIIGPRSKCRIVSIDEGSGKTGLNIIDREGNIVDSGKAKIVINRKTNKPRMLFKDPVYGEWIEPENFYSFSSDIFYEENKNIYYGKEGFAIEAINAPVWHGITSIGIKIKTNKDTLIFSSDTANDNVLWKQLYAEKRIQSCHNISKKQFEKSAVIYGDINDFIERIWSEERYIDAVNAFNDAVVMHDFSVRNSVVHTDYERLGNTCLEKDKTILTHGPDKITSEWVLCEASKTFKIKGDTFFELVDDKLYKMGANIFHKEAGKYFVGYKNKNGKYIVYEKDGLLGLSKNKSLNGEKPLYNVDLYQDISGKYYKKLDEENSIYFERKDGQVELVHFSENGSTGSKVVKNLRPEKSLAIDVKVTSPSTQKASKIIFELKNLYLIHINK